MAKNKNEIFNHLRGYAATATNISKNLTVVCLRIKKSKQKFVWPLKMGATGFSETSILKCQFALRNIPEEQRYYLQRGESLKSRNSR
jgi:hypothetical protein